MNLADRHNLLRAWVEVYLAECESVLADTLRDVGRPTAMDALEHRIARIKQTLLECPELPASAPSVPSGSASVLSVSQSDPLSKVQPSIPSAK
jgi:hypothetical protein